MSLKYSKHRIECFQIKNIGLRAVLDLDENAGGRSLKYDSEQKLMITLWFMLNYNSEMRKILDLNFSQFPPKFEWLKIVICQQYIYMIHFKNVMMFEMFKIKY